MKFNYKILHNYGNFLAVLKEIIFNVCEVREMSNDQTRAPVYEALEKLRRKRVVPFDVPGHKRGRGNPELVELLGDVFWHRYPAMLNISLLEGLHCPCRKNPQQCLCQFLLLLQLPQAPYEDLH